MVKPVASTAWDDELLGDLTAGAPVLSRQKKRARLDMVEFLEGQRGKRKAAVQVAERARKRQVVAGQPLSMQQAIGM
jgi:hypothetical protein